MCEYSFILFELLVDKSALAEDEVKVTSISYFKYGIVC